MLKQETINIKTNIYPWRRNVAGFISSSGPCASSSEQSQPEGHDVEGQDAQEDENAEQKYEGHVVVRVCKVQVLQYILGHNQVAVHLLAVQALAFVPENGHHASLQAVLQERYVEHPAHVDRCIFLHQKEAAELQERADEEGSQDAAQLEAQRSPHCQSNALRHQSRDEHNQEEEPEPPDFHGLLGHQVGGHYEQGTADDLDGQIRQGDGHVIRPQGVPAIEVLPRHDRKLQGNCN